MTNKEDNQQPEIVEKKLDQFLSETEKQLTNDDFYKTIKIKLGNNLIPFHYKPLENKVFFEMGRQPEDDRLNFILNKTLYNPDKKEFYTSKQLEPLNKRYGAVSLILANEIIKDAGFDEKYFR